jgi:hypothetical protein
MKCFSADEMEACIMNSNSPRKQQITEHLAACPHCSSLYDKQIQEQLHWSQELFKEVLPDSFTDRVMASLEREEIEFHSSNELSAPRKGMFKRKGTGFWKLKIGAALLLITISSVLLYSMPALADKLLSLFERSNVVDAGLLRAQDLGLIQHPNIKVEDQGYTVRIDEAAADPTRVILALQLFGPDGKHKRDQLVFTPLALHPGNRITIKDSGGQVIGEMYDMGSTEDFYYMVCNFNEPLQTDRITIDGHLTQLGNKMENIPPLKGNWSFSFSIDLHEAKAKTTVTPLEGSYPSPDGMTIRLKQLTRMVQGVRLEIDTELSTEALKRSPGELWKQQRLMFHFVDRKGNEIHSVNTRKNQHRNSLITESNRPGDRPGLMHWSYTFKYLPEDDPYTFVFDGYIISEHDESSIQFEPSKLKDRPVPFRFDGDDLMLKDFTVESPPNSNSEKAEGALHLSGKMWNDYRFSQWILKVPDGREYNLTMRGTASMEASNWKDGYLILGDGQLFEFRASGLTTVPDRLQLKRTVVERLYTNVDWSLPMPSTSYGTR